MSFSLAGGLVHFMVSGGTDADAEGLALAVAEQMQMPSQELATQRLTRFVQAGAHGPVPAKFKLRDADTERIRNFTSSEYAEYLKDHAIDTVRLGLAREDDLKTELALLLDVTRPVDKEVGAQIVKLVTTHYAWKLPLDQEEWSEERIAEKVCAVCVADWKAAAHLAEAARALTKGKIRAVIVAALRKKPSGKFKLPDAVCKELQAATVDQFAKEIAALVVGPVVAQLCDAKVPGIMKITQQVALYKGVREDTLQDAVLDAVLEHVLVHKLLANWPIVDSDPSCSGSSSGMKRSRDE